MTDGENWFAIVKKWSMQLCISLAVFDINAIFQFLTNQANGTVVFLFILHCLALKGVFENCFKKSNYHGEWSTVLLRMDQRNGYTVIIQ